MKIRETRAYLGHALEHVCILVVRRQKKSPVFASSSTFPVQRSNYHEVQCVCKIAPILALQLDPCIFPSASSISAGQLFYHNSFASVLDGSSHELVDLSWIACNRLFHQ